MVAEVGLAHEGSLAVAHSFVEAVAPAGARGVKFQCHVADAESGQDETWRVRTSMQDRSRRDYWLRTGFTPTQWRELADHARELGLLFGCSVFSVEAVDLLDEVDLDFWKVPSGELRTPELFEVLSDRAEPVVLSTGMSPWAEIDRAVDQLGRPPGGLIVTQCTSAYPCSFELVGLNVMTEMGQRYGLPMGLSDHSGTIYPAVIAAYLGASYVEVHVTLSPHLIGADRSVSLTIDRLADLVAGTGAGVVLGRCAVDKSRVPPEVEALRPVFMKSLCTTSDLDQGVVLEGRHLSSRKPGTGIPADEVDHVVGRRLRVPVGRRELLRYEDLEPDDG